MTNTVLQTTVQVVICIGWGSGIVLIYRWCGELRSWLKEGGSLIKLRRDVLLGTFAFSALLGLLMDLIARSFPGFLVLGCGLGVVAGPQMSKRLNAAASKTTEIDSPERTGRRRTPLYPWIIYCVAYAGAILTCAWEYSVRHVPGRLLLISVGPVFVFLTVVCYLQWSKWQDKHRHDGGRPAPGR